MERPPREMARDARVASLKIRVMPSGKRSEVLERIADVLEEKQQQILEKNGIDVQKAKGVIGEALMKRLQLKETKLQSAVDGIRQIARSEEPIGKCLFRTKVMKGLILEKVTVPIGVLLIIFEARPEALLQIAALAIRSGNGLLLKGGKEATESNVFLHSLICDVIDSVIPEVRSNFGVSVAMVMKHADLLKLHDVIDLVIPRGSNELVSYIQQNTKIAVLGHAEGICHVYVDEEADLSMAVNICVDAKLDYPAACNAAETVLVHKALLNKNELAVITDALKAKGVRLYKGVHPSLTSLPIDAAPDLSHEYSSLQVTIEVVDDLNAAVNHINAFGSGHTDAIVTKNSATAQEFLSRVDSACVFHNASTRWSDGYRFGLGAEVGISTSRIHARGPVGVEGLMTTKFVMHGNGHLVEGDAHKSAYQFKQLRTASFGSPSNAMCFASGALTVLGFCVLSRLFSSALQR